MISHKTALQLQDGVDKFAASLDQHAIVLPAPCLTALLDLVKIIHKSVDDRAV